MFPQVAADEEHEGGAHEHKGRVQPARAVRHIAAVAVATCAECAEGLLPPLLSPLVKMLLIDVIHQAHVVVGRGGDAVHEG